MQRRRSVSSLPLYRGQKTSPFKVFITSTSYILEIYLLLGFLCFCYNLCIFFFSLFILGLGKKRNFPIWAQLPTQLLGSEDIGSLGPKKTEEKELGVRACLLSTIGRYADKEPDIRMNG